MACKRPSAKASILSSVIVGAGCVVVARSFLPKSFGQQKQEGNALVHVQIHPVGTEAAQGIVVLSRISLLKKGVYFYDHVPMCWDIG